MSEDKCTAKIKIVKDGPYLVVGNIPMTKQTIIEDEHGQAVKWKADDCFPLKEQYALCSCGESSNSPYCDGTHQKIGYDGTETASKGNYLENPETIEGPDLILTDAQQLCALARFCHRKEGGVWDLTEESYNPEYRASAIQGAWDCPAGRLIAWNKKTGKAIEPPYVPSIGIIEDPAKKVSGPIWVRGGIPIESCDGTPYAVRNQLTLCRCGKSRNKPFCDASHVSKGYIAKTTDPSNTL
ncbi:iron-binding protein [Desulfosporosinus fructosivorans]|uniref:Iron-binding protein n=1 Tax=Desulfosporosinus fructosivorans TaxID=2018669 RepID=A0A4Z0R6S4_9FIRM|nr:CDGSH iron-sulfur domain-containing protein [Desulfosporosinus fructosivorans]TGE38528.1 iron-binding protein [Desulfosporosinus fructosivorans]